jgi:hypothetical protein
MRCTRACGYGARTSLGAFSASRCCPANSGAFNLACRVCRNPTESYRLLIRYRRARRHLKTIDGLEQRDDSTDTTCFVLQRIYCLHEGQFAFKNLSSHVASNAKGGVYATRILDAAIIVSFRKERQRIVAHALRLGFPADKCKPQGESLAPQGDGLMRSGGCGFGA